MATATTVTPDVAPIVPPNGDVPYEVVDGQIVEKPPMGAYPTWIASLLVQHLGPFVMANRLGRVLAEMLFRIDAAQNLQRRPDVAFVSYERWPRGRRVPDDAAWDVVPDLAIEVVSPTNTADEVLSRIREYFRAGVQRVWVVYPSEALVYLYESPTATRILKPGDEIDGGALLPGLRLPVAALFEEQAD